MSEIDFQQGLLTGLFFNKLTKRGIEANTIKVNREILLSTIRHNDFLIGTNPKYTDSTTQYSNAQIVTYITNLASSYPSDITLTNIGNSYNSNAMYALLVNDDGSKPIIGFSLGIHGNERAVHDALFEFLKNLMDASSGILKSIYDEFTFIILPNINPDGMIANIRNNGNDVNLNRNWPYYWNATVEIDKGSTASSESETTNIQSYMNTNNKVGRVLFWLDVHGWSSRTTYGFLTEQIAHDERYHSVQRNIYNHMTSMLSQVDFSSFTIVNDSPKITEYMSARKSYLYTWIKNKALENSYCTIFEYPQSENVGLCCEVFYHMLRGICLGAYDYNTSVFVGGSVLINPSYAIINNNSNLTDWNILESRPNWFTKTGLVLSQETDIDGSLYVESNRLVSSAWPHEVAFGADTNFSSEAFYIIGGENSSGTLALAKGQNEIDKSNITLPNITTGSINAAACNDGTYIYVVGGYNAGYLTAIYRIEPDAVTPSWSLWANLATGRQRHTCHIYNNYLWVVGGRDSSNYLNDIRRIDLSTKTETSFGTFTTARGWHKSAIYDGYLYICGGWSGASARGDVRKINLSTGAETSFSMPGARRQFALTQNDSIGYILGGDDGSSELTSIWKLDMSADTMTNVSYDLDSTYDEDGNLIEIEEPDIVGNHGFYNVLEGKHTFIGGEDSGGTFRDIAYEFDVDELILYMREALQNTWGYMRASSKFDCIVGEKYSLNMMVRNEGAINDNINPYVRIMLLTNPLSSILRKVRTQYLVPSQDWQEISLGFEIETGETEFRIYIRHYGNNTVIGIKKFQLCNQNINGVVDW